MCGGVEVIGQHIDGCVERAPGTRTQPIIDHGHGVDAGVPRNPQQVPGIGDRATHTAEPGGRLPPDAAAAA
jgi:hypothetical protein